MRDWASAVSEAAGLRNSPRPSRRPSNTSRRARVMLTATTAGVPESAIPEAVARARDQEDDEDLGAEVLRLRLTAQRLLYVQSPVDHVAQDARTVTHRRGRAWPRGAGGRGGGGCGGGGRGGGMAAGGTGGRQRGPQAPQTAGHRDRPHAPLRSLLVRPKMATISCPSLETRSSFQPRLRMSARQPMSFSHSWEVVRKTRKSATASHCGG